jgi:hypothetical protein
MLRSLSIIKTLMLIDKIFEKAAGDGHAWMHCTLGNKYLSQFLNILKTLSNEMEQRKSGYQHFLIFEN